MGVMRNFVGSAERSTPLLESQQANKRSALGDDSESGLHQPHDSGIGTRLAC